MLGGGWTGSQLIDFLINSTLILRPILWGIHVDGVLWTLEIEMLFYFIIALIGKKINSLRIVALSVIVLLGLYGGLIFLSKYFNIPFFDFLKYSIPHLMMMFCGVIFYNINSLFDKKIWRWVAVLFITLALASFILHMNFPKNPELMVSYALLPFVIWTTCFIFKDRLVYYKIFDFFANISFSLYLSHQVFGFIIIALLIRLGLNIHLIIIVASISSVLFACFLYYFIEKRAQNISRKF